MLPFSAPLPDREECSTLRLLAGLASRLWWFNILACVIMGVARVLIWVCHIEPSRFPGWYALTPGLELGVFYDVAVASALGLCWLIVLTPSLLLSSPWRRRALSLATVGLTVTLVGLALISAVEFYYFEFYHSRFDPLLFGLKENATGSVLVSVWANYPVVQVIVGSLVLGVALGWVMRWGARLSHQWLLNRSLLFRFIFTGLGLMLLPTIIWLVLGPSHVIQRHIRTPARDELGLTLAWNSPYTLARAISLHGDVESIGNDPTSNLSSWGFADLSAAAHAAGLNKTNADSVEKALFVKAPGTPRKDHPNVIIALLESFGADLMRTDAPDNDMMGRLRPHLTQEDWFTHFYAGQNATHPEIENLILGSPLTPLTLAPGRDFTFPSSGALPFKRAGYRTIFIYGGYKSRQNLGQVLSRQGFDEIYDERDLQHRFPKAGKTTWGVYDAYLFQFAQEVLNKESTPDHPVLIFLLTTTNHPPYVLDTPHRALPLNPAAMGNRGNSNLTLRRQIMATYQYQADQLGAFLDALDAGPHAQDTIVAAVGDHNLHEHYKYKFPEETPDADRVFGFFHIPSRWRPTTPVDHARFAGHKDIIPTLVSLALPGSTYFNTGVNLFAPAKSEDYGLAQFERIYQDQGMIDGLSGQPTLYPWTRRNERVEGIGEPLPPALSPGLKKIMANVALRDWYMRRQVIEHRSNSTRAGNTH